LGLLKLDVIIFGSVWFLSKKLNRNYLKKKKTKTSSNQPVSVWFFRTKTGSNWFCTIFFGLAWFLPV
jgi:hypothetical protein